MEDVEPNIVIGLEKVENGGENVQRQARAIDGGRRDWFREVFAHAREEHVDTRRLDDEVDQEIIRRSKLLLRGAVERSRRGHQLLEGIILLVLVEEGLDFGSNMEVFGQPRVILLAQIIQRSKLCSPCWTLKAIQAYP